jgi:AcrR family transcriptional regulator
MAASGAPSRVRKSAEERRDEVVEAALLHFAHQGYNGTSTEAVARDAGISQPYLFRLFGTKRELFLACYDRMCDRLLGLFREAAEGAAPEDRLQAMGKAYTEGLVADRPMLLMQMQSYAACADADIQAHVRRRFAALVHEVERLTGAGPGEVWSFFSAGMLLNVVASLDLPAIADEEPWTVGWRDPAAMIERTEEERSTTGVPRRPGGSG